MCKQPWGRLIFASPSQPRTSPPLRSLMAASSARRLPAYLVPPPQPASPPLARSREKMWGRMNSKLNSDVTYHCVVVWT